MSSVVIYITTSGEEEARAIGRALVEERLAACVNILAPISSVYRWEGAVRDDPEVPLIVKTRADLVAPLTARVRELHSYSCPCVIALPITDGNPEFLKWIERETAQ